MARLQHLPGPPMTLAGPAAASPPRAWKSRVLEIRDECLGVRTIRIESPQDFSFIPGMFVMVRFADNPKVSRAYSISSSPFEKGAIEISMSEVGPLTSRLFALKGGEALTVKGPYGKWHYHDEARRAVLISGGTGITPFRSICRYVLEKKLPNKITILYSAKTPEGILYQEELRAFARAGIKVYTTITRPDAGRRWDGPTGRLGIETVVKEVEDYAQAYYFLCGPLSLVEDFTDGLREKGIPKERILYEKWGDY